MAAIAIFLFCGNLAAMNCEKLRQTRQWPEKNYQECVDYKKNIQEGCERRKLVGPVQECIEFEETDWLRRHPDPGQYWKCDQGIFSNMGAREKCRRIETEFWAWAGRPLDLAALELKSDAWFLPRYLLICNQRELLINEYNAIMYGGGYYYPDNLNDGCYALRDSYIGRIAETFPNSEVVKIQYKDAMFKDVREVFTHRDLITPMSEYRKRLVKN